MEINNLKPHVWKENSLLYFTCTACDKYSYWTSHCRSCGNTFCTQCVSVIDKSLQAYMRLCDNMPEKYTSVLKTCSACVKIAKFRKHVVLFAKLLLHLYRLNQQKHGILFWTELTERSTLPNVVRKSALLLIKGYHRIRVAERIQYMTPKHDCETEFETMLAAAEETVLFYDVCNRTEKYQSKHNVIFRLACPIYLMLSAAQAGYDASVFRVLSKKKKKGLSAVLHLLSKQYIEKLVPLIPKIGFAIHKNSHPQLASQKNTLHGVTNVIVKQWLSTGKKLFDLLAEFNEDGNMNEQLCLDLMNANVMYNLSSVESKGMTIVNQLNRNVIRLTNNDEQILCFCGIDIRLLQAQVYLSTAFTAHYYNLTVFDCEDSKHNVFLMKNSSSSIEAYNSVSMNCLQDVAEILTCIGYLRGSCIRFEQVQYAIDSVNKQMILLNISTESTQEDFPLSAKSVEIYNKIQVQKRWFAPEHRYWLVKILGGTDEQAKEYALAPLNGLEQYFVMDIM